ncbi:MAG: GNAT family N-acetyltransferase [Anaerolineae bacterium]|jgi:GNAT superfamily N-acetyltransferase
MITGAEFGAVVYGYWADRFGCAREDFHRPGTLVSEDGALGEAGVVYVYRIDQHSVVRMGPELAGEIGLVGRQGGLSAALSANEIRAMIAPLRSVAMGRILLDCYLDGRAFQPWPVPGDLVARRVHPRQDGALLHDLYDACSEIDLDEAEIYVDKPDPVIFGLFDGSLLVAYASHRYWGRIIADIGVLIHPAYRSRGLGKAVVSVLCGWCLEKDVLPMYRVHTDHLHSLGIARALGFQELVVIESLELVGVTDG